MKFSERCYSLLSRVPRGKVTTYKEIANALKSRAYRAVGKAMKENKNAPRIPCHRVVRSNGEIGGYMGSDKDNMKKKIELLRTESVEIKDNRIELEKYLYKFTIYRDLC